MTTTPHRITRWQWTRARIAVLIGLEPEHPGATADWAKQLRDSLTNRPAISSATDTPTAIIPAIRRPVAALTAGPHFEACDDLGPWNPSQHELQPAYIHDELAGALR